MPTPSKPLTKTNRCRRSRSSDDDKISSDRSLTHSLSEVEEDSDDDRVGIGLNGTLAPICATPPRPTDNDDKDQSTSTTGSSLVWAITPGATCTPLATVISSSPSSHSLTLPFARPIGSPPRFHLSPTKTNNRTKTTSMSSNDGEAHNKEAEANGSSSSSDKGHRMTQPEPLVPVASLQTGLQRKASPLQLQSWCKMLLTLDGCDKFTKVLQYWSRLLAWWLMAGSSAQKRANALKVSLTTSRKAFRLGRSVIEVQKLQDQGFWEWLLLNSRSKSGASDPAWKVLGTALKTIGLLGFWAFDNASFLTGSGVLDDHSIQEPKVRLQKRQQLGASCSILANRSYFAGSVAGLITSWRSYREHRAKLRQLLSENKNAADDDDEQQQQQLQQEVIKKAKQEQFVLFLALLKSCCDVLVFSNNPGIDFWKKARGKKMHEGLHCVAGLLSASTVLYNKYPDA